MKKLTEKEISFIVNGDKNNRLKYFIHNAGYGGKVVYLIKENIIYCWTSKMFLSEPAESGGVEAGVVAFCKMLKGLNVESCDYKVAVFPNGKDYLGMTIGELYILLVFEIESYYRWASKEADNMDQRIYHNLCVEYSLINRKNMR